MKMLKNVASTIFFLINHSLPHQPFSSSSTIFFLINLGMAYGNVWS